jgi:hypothetical protein
MHKLARLVHKHALHQLGLQIIGQEYVVEKLALAAAKHTIAPESGQRIVLIGPPGCGKTTAAIALAECIKRPAVRVSVEDMSATGWSGTQLGDSLADIERQAGAVAYAFPLRGCGVEVLRVDLPVSGPQRGEPTSSLSDLRRSWARRRSVIVRCSNASSTAASGLTLWRHNVAPFNYYRRVGHEWENDYETGRA